jgi:hypothetical protein
MNSTDRFLQGQAVYITNLNREFAWPALVAEIIDGQWLTLLFSNGEMAQIEARYCALLPEVTKATLDWRITPCPEEFFHTPAVELEALPSAEFPAIALSPQEQAATERDHVPMLAAEKKSKSVAVLNVQELAPNPTAAAVKLMQMPGRPPSKRQGSLRRRRLSNKLSLHRQYHQRIGEARDEESCCGPADCCCCTIL